MDCELDECLHIQVFKSLPIYSILITIIIITELKIKLSFKKSNIIIINRTIKVLKSNEIFNLLNVKNSNGMKLRSNVNSSTRVILPFIIKTLLFTTDLKIRSLSIMEPVSITVSLLSVYWMFQRNSVKSIWEGLKVVIGTKENKAEKAIERTTKREEFYVTGSKV